MPEIRLAQSDDLPAVGEVFAAGFAHSIEHAGSSHAGARAMADIFGLALAAEPGSLMVAERGGQVVGYALGSCDIRRLQWRAFWRGGWARVLLRAVTGAYGIRWQTVRTVLGDKLSFLRGARIGTEHRARMLSLAVHPDHQGQGTGRRLFAAGLRRLETIGCAGIRLEVRPDNAPARHLYECFGFRPCGQYSDSQGQWLIMLKEVRQAPDPL